MSEMAATSVSKVGSHIERAMGKWMEQAEAMAAEAEATWDERERQVCFANSQYARGRADGLLQALRILGREA
jgi:hypothetical protein